MSQSNLYKILLAIVLNFFIGCSTPIVNESREEELVERPDHESWDVRITITNAGKKRAFIQADYLEQFDDKNFISLENNVKMDFFDANEEHMSSLSAD